MLTKPHRYPERVSQDRELAYAILDEGAVCHLGYLAAGVPRVLPTLHVRVGDTLYLHGSTGSGPMLAAREPGSVCVTVTLHDAWVLARSYFHHSVNYRSVVVYGTPRLVDDPAEKRRVLRCLVEKVAAGRAADSRPPADKELGATAVLALPLSEFSVKRRTGGPLDDEEDYALPHWAGVVPLRVAPGIPEPDPRSTAPLPGYLRAAPEPWLEPVVLRGSHVVLEPMDMSHVDALFAALDDEEVYRYVPFPRPENVADMAALVRRFLEAAADGIRVPYVQRAVATGQIVGTTSYSWWDRAPNRVEIGGTQLARGWWRTGVNTEAKLMLMRRAFEDLGAERVEWQTDVLNTRSQAAIQRLGATREGVLRHNRTRSDGSWRDSVIYSMLAQEWPAARERLEAWLAGGAQSGAANRCR